MMNKRTAVMTWRHSVAATDTALLAECPMCYSVHGLVNPPHGMVNVVIEHEPGRCSMYVDGVAAQQLKSGGRANTRTAANISVTPTRVGRILTISSTSRKTRSVEIKLTNEQAAILGLDKVVGDINLGDIEAVWDRIEFMTNGSDN